jgi:hypothetical protein
MIPISSQDRTALDTLRQLIDDPQISLETRSELRAESLGIATGYIVAEALQDTDAEDPAQEDGIANHFRQLNGSGVERCGLGLAKIFDREQAPICALHD